MTDNTFIENLEQAKKLIENDNRPIMPTKVYVPPYGYLKVRYTHGCCIDTKYLLEQIEKIKNGEH